ncbi:flavin-containing monooxygenase [Mycobacterium sp. pUA109]|uniref:flavin-containing monooxygenase n=1 Tax=Mycobacterium sp. pUA109 TaxID=3238982 RepID=UPI00351AEC1A
MTAVDIASSSAAAGTKQRPSVHTRALIIGTGFSGLGMAIALQKQGIEFVVLEKAGSIGGTWRDNSYPGAACDVPAHLYSFSFEPKSDWTHLFSYQREILTYLEAVTSKYDLHRHIVFGAKVVCAQWNEANCRWHVHTDEGGEYIAQFLISGAGALHIPSIPTIDGLETFDGPVFHSAQWRHDVDLTHKRVAVIGTGASAVQLVPEIVGRVSKLQLYQRTPAWVLPRSNVEMPRLVREALKRIPGARAALRAGIYWSAEGGAYAMNRRPSLLKAVEVLGRRHIKRTIADPELRRKLTPDYRPGCKRLLGSNGYYQAIDSTKTELITDGISSVTANGIVAADGTHRPVDVIVLATGFHVTDSYRHIDITGPRKENLGQRWTRAGVTAHRGTTVTDMPNLFLLLGPNTGLGHTSVVFMIESQIHYAIEAIKTVDSEGADAIAPLKSAQDRFNEALQQGLARSVWNSGGCWSWYLDEHGHNRTLWSGFTWQYWLSTRKVKREEYRLLTARHPRVRMTVPAADGPCKRSPSPYPIKLGQRRK